MGRADQRSQVSSFPMGPTTSRFPRIILLVIAVLGTTELPSAPAATLAPATSADHFFKPPDFTAPAISPDGTNVGFIAQSNGHASLFRLDLKTGEIAGIFSAGDGDVEAFWWTGNRRLLVAALGEEGREYFVQDLANSKPRPVRILKGSPTSWIIIPPNVTDHVFALDYWRQAYLARIDLTSGHSSKIESLISDFDYTVVSRDGEVRAKFWQDMGKWHIAWRASAKQPWHTLESSNENWPAFAPVGLAADGHHILVYAYDQGDTIALMQLDPNTDQRTLLAQRPDRDVYGLFKQGTDRVFVGAKFYNNGAEDLVFFDEPAKQFSAALDRSLPGMIHYVTSASADGTMRIVEAWLPGYPSHYFLYDGIQHRLSKLGEQRPGLPAGSLGEVRPFQFKTRDGLTESGYVLLPRQSDRAHPVPLIVMAMQTVGERIPTASHFHPDDQYFASRGFAVAHFAVRGTTGFGRTFDNAGNFQLGGKIVHDFEDGVAYLGQTGLVDPQRVALVGYGLGGLFALRTAAVSTSFHAVVAYDTRCDLTANSISWLSNSIAEVPVVLKQAGGTQAAYDLVHQFEPESYIEKLSVPVLLANSAWFGATGGAQGSNQIRASFDRHHKPYEWYELDFHDADRAKRGDYDIRFYTRIADFLDKALK